MRLRTERPYSGKGLCLTFQPFARGAGYRAYDFPWHSMSKFSPRWRTHAWLSYVPGFTFQFIRNAKVYRKGMQQPVKRHRVWISVSKNGNSRAFPGWW